MVIVSNSLKDEDVASKQNSEWSNGKRVNHRKVKQTAMFITTSLTRGNQRIKKLGK
jgi:hypothetical protein